jgi:hypothetical protein
LFGRVSSRTAQTGCTTDTPSDRLETIPQATGLFVGLKPELYPVSPESGFAALAMVFVQIHGAASGASPKRTA